MRIAAPHPIRDRSVASRRNEGYTQREIVKALNTKKCRVEKAYKAIDERAYGSRCRLIVGLLAKCRRTPKRSFE